MKNWILEISTQSGSNKNSFSQFIGIGFWFTKEKKKNGILFGNTNNFEGIGILLSEKIEVIYQYNSNDNLKQKTILQFPISYFGLKEITKLRVIYIDNKLIVQLDLKSIGVWNLIGTESIDLPTDYFFGITSSHFESEIYHYIYSFKIYEIPDSKSRNIISLRNEKEKQQKRVESYKFQASLDLLKKLENNFEDGEKEEEEVLIIERLMKKYSIDLFAEKIVNLIEEIIKIDLEAKKNYQKTKNLEITYSRIQNSFLEQVNLNIKYIEQATTDVIDQVKDIRKSSEFLNNRFDQIIFQRQTKQNLIAINKKSSSYFWVFFIIFEIVFFIFILNWATIQRNIYKLF
ncbi:vesicular mannose-binding lectin [Anaeramoeba ignava]|uniref:Vesicular mannose-binding lectin n=1 Tax=Anaeramoeba ignava TaxID=1746090 RepID=A0A9Q0LZG7_ANAIG|nr:vesicular mannose-binding lectin [Anaeramoeba ignava]